MSSPVQSANSARLAVPRVLTLDPDGLLSRLIRAMFDAAEMAAVQLDAPTAEDALAEAEHGVPLHVVVAACTPLVADPAEAGRFAAQFAEAMRERQPDAALIFVLDAETTAEAYAPLEAALDARMIALPQPLDPQVWVRVVGAALRGESLQSALNVPSAGIVGGADERLSSPIPPMDAKAARSVLERLRGDVGAPGLFLLSRAGQVVAEIGVPDLPMEHLGAVLAPSLLTTHDMGQMVGGRAAAIHVYDGETHDLFALSVGVHYLLVCVYDGQSGMRQLGSINRYARRATEDLITVLGANAHVLTERPALPVTDATAEMAAEDEAGGRRTTSPRRPRHAPATEPELDPMIVTPVLDLPIPAPTPEAEPLRLEPIAELDLSLFNKRALDSLDIGDFDDLFNPDALAEIANETRGGRGSLTHDEARELGIL